MIDLEEDFEQILDDIDNFSCIDINSFIYDENIESNKNELLKKFEILRERLILIGCSISKIEVNNKRIQMKISW